MATAKKAAKKEKDAASLKLTCIGNNVDIEIEGSQSLLLAAIVAVIGDDDENNTFRKLIINAIEYTVYEAMSGKEEVKIKSRKYNR